jgi:hypothetical protein
MAHPQMISLAACRKGTAVALRAPADGIRSVTDGRGELVNRTAELDARLLEGYRDSLRLRARTRPTNTTP